MISMESMDLGTTVKRLREKKGMSRTEVSDAAGISESHLKKIENGIRKPGLETYRKIMGVLEVDVVLKNSDGTVRGECAARVQKVFLEITEAQALFLVQALEFMAQNIGEVK